MTIDLLARAIAWLLLFGLLCAPGILAQRRLAPGLAEGPYESAAFGTLFSFGAFSIVTGPFLLAQRSFTEACIAVVLAWLAGMTWGVSSLLRERRLNSSQPRNVSSDEADPAEAPLDLEPSFYLPAVRIRLATLVVTLLTWGSAWATVHGPSKKIGLVLLALMAIVNAALALVAWRAKPNTKQVTNGGPPKQVILRIFQISLIVAAAVAATLWVAEDSDDMLYLSEVLMLEGAPAMGAFAPTERGEALPPTALYAWQSFELLGAMLAGATGLHGIIGMRLVMAPIVVLLTLAIWQAWLRRALPSWFLPLAVGLIAAYYLFGASLHDLSSKYVMVRAAHGKTWLNSLATPALFLITLHFMRQPRIGPYLVLFAVNVAAVGFAPTAAFLVPNVIGAAALSAWVLARRIEITPAILAGTTALPGLIFALSISWLQPDLNLETALSFDKSATWQNSILFGVFGIGRNSGVLELFALACVPQLALASFSRAHFTILLPVLALLAVPLNPILHPLLIDVLGYSAYNRLFWTLPIPLLIGALGATWFHLAAGEHRRIGLGLLAVATLLASFPLSDAFSPFSSRNMRYGSDVNTPPYLAPNPFKMKDGLLLVAEEIARRNPEPKQKILCTARVVSHLAPFDTRFGFVYVSRFQTETALELGGRGEEIPPLRAAHDYLRDPTIQTTPEWQQVARNPETLLAQVGARWIVTGPHSAAATLDLPRHGYAKVLRAEEFTLWQPRSFQGAAQP